MPDALPAVSLTAVPGRRARTLEIARELERRGFPGIFSPSPRAGMALMAQLAQTTTKVEFGTSIAPIYFRLPEEYANEAAFLHELSGGRFRFGIGISHGPAYERMGITPGRPLADVRDFVARMRAAEEETGPLPPVVLAALRKGMIRLAGEIGDGMVFANGARSHMAVSLGVLPEAKRSDPGFFIGCMTPTCISDDIPAAKAVNRRTLTRYAALPNYRNYWKEAGYEQEMADVETALAANDMEGVAKALTDDWLADVTLFGPAGKVREEVERWRQAGIRTPILVPSSAHGNQMKAFEELFAAFA